MGHLLFLGWQDCATRLLLFDVFVRTSLLYGVPVWGMAYLPQHGGVEWDWMGWLGVFYWRCLHTLLGVSRATYNEVLYVLSGWGPSSLIW